MRGEVSGGTHGGVQRRQRNSLGKPWRKIFSKLGGGDEVRGTHSRGRGKTLGTDKQVFGDAGAETGNTQVGR